MKYLNYCVLLLLLIGYACDNRKDAFDGQRTKIFLQKIGQTDLTTDLKDSVKGSNVYTCNYSLSPNASLVITSNMVKGHANISILNGKINISPQDTLVIIDFSVSDNGTISKATVELVHFKNLSPVAVFTVTKSGYKIHIDASGSYDSDAKYGGKIVNYDYEISPGSYSVPSTTLNSIDYSVSSVGDYIINVRVQDKDNQWSQFVATSVTIN